MIEELFRGIMPRSNQRFDFGDGALIGLSALLIAIAAFHPYYFGDELFTFSVADQSDNDFLTTFWTLNGYKPRFVFNGIWAFIASCSVSRWVPFFLYVGFTTGAALTVYALARGTFGSDRITGLLAASVILLGRFGVMLPHDYVAGIIESSSLLFFLMGVRLLLHDRESHNWSRMAGAALFFLLAIFSHERYLVATVAVATWLVLYALWHRHRDITRGRAELVGGILLAFVPAATFFVVTKLVSDLPVTTGTAGIAVEIGAPTLMAFGTYLSNTLLGTNFGHPWFVGELPPGAVGRSFLIASAVLMTAGWVCWGRRARPNWASLCLIMAFFSLIAVASLPGPERQELRWMYPAAALLAVLVVSSGTKRAQQFLLLVMLAISLVYGWIGRPDLIYNVDASRMARLIGTALNTVAPPGRTGVVIGAREPDISWVLGGGNYGPKLSSVPGVAFSRTNLPLGTRIFPGSMARAPAGEAFDFGVILRSGGPGIPASVRYLGQETLQAVLRPDEVPRGAGTTLGGVGAWTEWRWKRGPAPYAAVELVPGLDGFLQLPAVELDGKVLLYTGRSETDAPVSMRLQVNWVDAQDRLIDASIKVVEVDKEVRSYAMPVFAPPGAINGYVYVTLHGQSGAVLLDSVRLL